MKTVTGILAIVLLLVCAWRYQKGDAAGVALYMGLSLWNYLSYLNN